MYAWRIDERNAQIEWEAIFNDHGWHQVDINYFVCQDILSLCLTNKCEQRLSICKIWSLVEIKSLLQNYQRNQCTPILKAHIGISEIRYISCDLLDFLNLSDSASLWATQLIFCQVQLLTLICLWNDYLNLYLAVVQTHR